MNTNDWTTIRSGGSAATQTWGSRSSAQPRQMPSAFGSGMDDDRTNKRREQERANMEADAAIKAREAREVKAKREAAAAKDRDALALNSETSYPSLGSNTVATPSKFATNFRDKVAAMAAREKEVEEMRALAAEAAAAESFSSNWVPTGLSAAAAAHRRRTLIGNRCFDDGIEDYDGPEEDFGDNEYMSDNEDNEPPADNGEHNAHLGDIHRRNKHSLY